jgi:hypothetical protein
MGIPVPITKQEYDATSADATGSLRPFPFCLNRWLDFTAELQKIEIVTWNDSDVLVFEGVNDCYSVKISVPLDPANVNSFGGDVEAKIRKNKEKLIRLIKAFDIGRWKGQTLEVDPNLFSKAIGKCFMFSVRGQNNGSSPRINPKGFAMFNICFKQIVDGIEPVAVPMDAVSNRPAQAVASGSVNNTSDPGAYDDDIPF